MIKGFEDYTHELKKNELDLINDFINFFKNRKGSKKAVTNKKIILSFEKLFEIRLSPARVRKIINYLRTNKIIKNLIASSNGYYIEEDPDLVLIYKNSLLQRANEIIKVAESFEVITQQKIDF